MLSKQSIATIIILLKRKNSYFYLLFLYRYCRLRISQYSLFFFFLIQFKILKISFFFYLNKKIYLKYIEPLETLYLELSFNFDDSVMKISNLWGARLKVFCLERNAISKSLARKESAVVHIRSNIVVETRKNIDGIWLRIDDLSKSRAKIILSPRKNLDVECIPTKRGM